MTKEMIYEPQMRKEDFLERGTYKGFSYMVVSYGQHPCCYIEIPQGHKFYRKDYDSNELRDIDCHGGLTFADFRDFGDGLNYYIGWDYAHYNDYAGYYMLFDPQPTIPLKKWTTEEMSNECKSVIDQIQECE